MKLRSLILLLAGVIVISCSKAETDGGNVFALIKGSVTDTEGHPIEHLEVTIDLSRKAGQKTSYTSSDGKFMSDITFKEAKNLKSIIITITDIDGDENGGFFESKTEEIFIYEEDVIEIPILLNLDFRCSLSTL